MSKGKAARDRETSPEPWTGLEKVCQSFGSDASAQGCGTRRPAEQWKRTGRREVEGAREDAGSFPSTRRDPKQGKYAPGPQGMGTALGGGWGEAALGPPGLRPLVLLLTDTPAPPEGAASLKGRGQSLLSVLPKSLFLAKVFLWPFLERKRQTLFTVPCSAFQRTTPPLALQRWGGTPGIRVRNNTEGRFPGNKEEGSD